MKISHLSLSFIAHAVLKFLISFSKSSRGGCSSTQSATFWLANELCRAGHITKISHLSLSFIGHSVIWFLVYFSESSRGGCSPARSATCWFAGELCGAVQGLRRTGRTCSRYDRAGSEKGRRQGHCQDAVQTRDYCFRGVHGDRRTGFQCGSQQESYRQGRAEPLAGNQARVGLVAEKNGTLRAKD